MDLFMDCFSLYTYMCTLRLRYSKIRKVFFFFFSEDPRIETVERKKTDKIQSTLFDEVDPE